MTLGCLEGKTVKSVQSVSQSNMQGQQGFFATAESAAAQNDIQRLWNRPQSWEQLGARVGEEIFRERQGGVDQPGADRPVRDVVEPDHVLRSQAHILEDEQQVAAIRAELWVAIAAGAFDRVGLEAAVQVGAVDPQVAEAVVALVTG